MENPVEPKQVIICDDDADICDFLSVVLESAGYEPLIAKSIDEVYDLLKFKHPELLLLDVIMPEQNGFEIAESLNAQGVPLPIIFISAHDANFSRMYAPAVGAMAYFTKPLDHRALLVKINQVICEQDFLIS